MDHLIQRTLWVTERDGRFVALDYQGNIVNEHKHKATLVYILRHEPKSSLWAIAVVVAPHKRQPNRALIKR